ncbi:vinorine synthase-like [Magnolia sinica]|uniref:vinorine synthase-like n=1 Tax=Magnolia sinica TaxID=86752 RepID=UPI00265965E7|nr:vinorine synthase-like [Magnolia sinica]
MWNVEIISLETIKPSSPTPQHLCRLQLSLLDQLSPRIYIRLVLFYSKNDSSPVQKSHQLKKSLSETLTRFYPLAGRIEGNSSVECNDMGVDFVEARVDGQLSAFLQMPDIEKITQFLPCDATRTRSGRDTLLAIQANVFDCGGLAIGVGISHKISDGASCFTFLNGWAATSRGADEAMGPTFNSASLFPPREVPISADSSIITVEENLVTKRFVFDGSKIAALITRASNAVGPTRVEAVSVLIWRSIMRARGEVGSTRASAALQAVCLRRRMVPPLPDNSFGNIVSGAISSVVVEKYNGDMQHYLEGQMRDAIRKVDGNHIRRLQGPGGPQESQGPFRALGEKYSHCGLDLCIFSSWCRFPIYEVDFGWGRPIWVSQGRNHIRNSTVLMGTRSDDGIEAFICMEEAEMSRFQHDQELLSFASIPTVGFP